MANICVVGGGISGLSTAYYLIKHLGCRLNKVILLEASSRLGGWLDSWQNDSGAIFETGPRSIRAVLNESGFNILTLIEDLNLSKEVIPVTRNSAAARLRYLYTNNEMHALPHGMGAMLRKQKPFSSSFASCLAREPFQQRRPQHIEDESIHDFVCRRLGNDLAKYGVDPFCRGVYAGNSKKLSIKSCLPLLHDLENQHGSLIVGMYRNRKKPRPFDIKTCDLAMKAKAEHWAIWTLTRGLSQLPEAMHSYLNQADNINIHINTKCTGISKTDDGRIQVTTDSDVFHCDHVFSALPANNLSPLLKSHPDMATMLDRIPFVHVGVVNLEYDGDLLQHKGFGHLIPSSESTKNLGIVYDSCVFPQHDNKNRQSTTRLTCMMGGDWFTSVFGDVDKLTTDALTDAALTSVSEQLHINQDPNIVRPLILKNAIAQYTVGHDQRLEQLEQLITDAALPLSLVGASYRGVSVGDCILHAKKSVQNYVNNL